MLWINFAVKAGFSWPNVPVEIPFEGSTIVLSPATGDLACTASLYHPAGFELEDGATRLSRFLSLLAWSRNGGIEELFATGSNNPTQPGRLGKGNYGKSSWADVEPWHALYLPMPLTPEALLALALFREGATLNSPPLAFLSHFKVLNTVFEKGSAQSDWINNHLKLVEHGRAKERLTELKLRHQDIGKYLYKQGRCAVAHAFSTPVANPDDYVDRIRLRDDLPLIERLAELCIELELNVPTAESFWQTCRRASTLPSVYLVPDPRSAGRVRYRPYKAEDDV